MKDYNQKNQNTNKLKNLEVACGNCWGHQQYEQGYREQKIDHWRGKKENFISRFIKKYLYK